jgi:hypothetical protein
MIALEGNAIAGDLLEVFGVDLRLLDLTILDN